MAHPDLTSHHVNYLIWRYLQESGLGEAAVMLQRAWNQDPQTLPFAPYIKTHALVGLVQKGLYYHELEQSIDKDGNPISLPPENDFFGPIEPEKTGETRTSQTASPPAEINGHLTVEAAKVGRKEASSETLKPDTNGVNHKSPPLVEIQSPKGVLLDGDGDRDGDVCMKVPVDETQELEPEPEAESVPPIMTFTMGRSIGVQISLAKDIDLSPYTATFTVAPQSHVGRSLWRPGDPNMLATAGDSFCSIWRLSSSSPPIEERIVEDDNGHAIVTAISWDPTGQKLAIATYSDLCGTVSIYTPRGYALDFLPELSRMVTGLYWTPNDHRLLIIASSHALTEMAIWPENAEFVRPQTVDGPIYDFSWSSDSQAYVCGNGVVHQCEIDSGIRTSETFLSGSPATSWSFIRSTSIGGLPVAVTASCETAALWVPTHDMRLEDAHHGDITTIELQVQPQTWTNLQSQRIILASFGLDNTVRIWHIDLEEKRFNCLHGLFLGLSSPALAGSLSPDGYAVAAVSRDRLFIWNTERGDVLATWAMPGPEEVKTEDAHDQALNGRKGDTEYLPDRTLSWDSDGKKLAVGFGRQMGIVNMQH